MLCSPTILKIPLKFCHTHPYFSSQSFEDIVWDDEDKGTDAVGSAAASHVEAVAAIDVSISISKYNTES